MVFFFTSSGKDAKKIAGLGVGLLLSGCLCLLVASFGSPYKVVLQALFALLVVAALFFWIRFLLLTYRYEVIRDGDDYFLQIVQVQKMRQTTLMQFEVKNILSVKRYKKGEKPAKREFSHCYTYNTAIFSPTVALFVKAAEKTVAIVLEDDEIFMAKLEKLCNAIGVGASHDPGEHFGSKNEEVE